MAWVVASQTEDAPPDGDVPVNLDGFWLLPDPRCCSLVIEKMAGEVAARSCLPLMESLDLSRGDMSQGDQDPCHPGGEAGHREVQTQPSSR